MTTVNSRNVFNIALKGTFDDCQDIIKKLFRDNELNKNLNLGSINSINWTRIMSQITYYIYAYNKIKSETERLILVLVYPRETLEMLMQGILRKKSLKYLSRK